MPRAVVIAIAVTLVSGAGPAGQASQGAARAWPGAGDIAPGRASIREDDLRRDLAVFASERMQGRLTATSGNDLAAELIHARFQALGLKPLSGASYFQPYALMTATLGAFADNAIRARVGGTTVRGMMGRDLYPHRFSATARARGPVTFAGFGLVAPEVGYDDYLGADVRGRVVLVLDHEPGERNPGSRFDGLVNAEAATPQRKALAAQDKGAVAILFVHDVHNHPDAAGLPAEAAMMWPTQVPRIAPYTLAQWADRVRIPAVQISRELASKLMGGTGQSLDELSRASESLGRASVQVARVEVEVSTSVARRVVPDRNVVAGLDGGDPRLRDEWVIVGAHLDHDGASGDSVFAGADDNASGIVGMLEIAEAYAEAAAEGRRPRRSLLFAAWNSEERGLLGAWAYTEQPAVPLDRTVAVLNLDMIGRNEEVPAAGGLRFQGLEPQSAESNMNAVNLLGYSYAPELSDEVTYANEAFGLDLRRRYDNTTANLIRRSDQWPFLQRGVAAIWFHTGLHPDYHTFGDQPDKINYEKMTRIVGLVHQTIWRVAQRDRRPRVVRPQ